MSAEENELDPRIKVSCNKKIKCVDETLFTDLPDLQSIDRRKTFDANFNVGITRFMFFVEMI